MPTRSDPQSSAAPSGPEPAAAHSGPERPVETDQSAVQPPDDPLAEWERLLDRLSDARKNTLVGLYEPGRVLRWDQSGIEIGFTPSMSSLADMATSSDYIDAMKSFLRQHYGRPVELTVRVLTEEEATSMEASRSVVELNQLRAEEEHKKREAEVRLHPIYTKVIETFGKPMKEEINTDV